MSSHLFGAEQFPTAAARPGAVFRGEHYRFTILTSRLIRLEWSPTGDFVDHQTQVVVNRDFGTADVDVVETEETLELRTEHLTLSYDKQGFTPSGLSIALHQNASGTLRTRWRFGDELTGDIGTGGNLGGTARTLDGVDGECPLEPGVLSRYGFAVIDDSSSVKVGVDDWIAPRAPGGHDLYFFGHGLDFRGALADFFQLTGPIPLVPRAVLGNWWSRFWKYSDEDYLSLMDRFEADGIPFSVSVVDMDWHLVDIDPRLGSGWTGYTWNPALFPDPPAFLRALHDRGKQVTLNLHPADGVRAHEDAYPAMAADLGLDPAAGDPIAFDITDREFVESYLRRLHHPLEEQGVDFWWLDWQSGDVTRVPGLDPLWMLNHIHYRDSARASRRPLTFSRYAGIGSHRHPVGFSGDTMATWASLDFQPYFTATAANVGFTWWSHDIGGHYGGRRDDELSVRWLQFGAFSPINRLHSSADPFNSKDPGRFPLEVRQIMTQFLRLRHLLVPYIYTAAWRAHSEGIAVVRPMYHDHPEVPDAYDVPNEYLFGDDMIVAPITSPADAHSGLASATVWLPEGTWYDLFTGQRYNGGRSLAMHRSLERIPVLVRAGAAIPMLEDPLQDIGATPELLVLRVVPGDGCSLVVEDDGSPGPTSHERQETRVDVRADADSLVVRVESNTGGRDLILDVVGCVAIASIERNGFAIDVRTEPIVVENLAPALRIRLGNQDLGDGTCLVLRGTVYDSPHPEARAFDLVDRAPIEYSLKHEVHRAMRELRGIALAQRLSTLDMPDSLRGALLEIAVD